MTPRPGNLLTAWREATDKNKRLAAEVAKLQAAKESAEALTLHLARDKPGVTYCAYCLEVICEHPTSVQVWDHTEQCEKHPIHGVIEECEHQKKEKAELLRAGTVLRQMLRDAGGAELFRGTMGDDSQGHDEAVIVSERALGVWDGLATKHGGSGT